MKVRVYGQTQHEVIERGNRFARLGRRMDAFGQETASSADSLSLVEEEEKSSVISNDLDSYIESIIEPELKQCYSHGHVISDNVFATIRLGCIGGFVTSVFFGGFDVTAAFIVVSAYLTYTAFKDWHKSLKELNKRIK